jgi:hypothetical protein
MLSKISYFMRNWPLNFFSIDIKSSHVKKIYEVNCHTRF